MCLIWITLLMIAFSKICWCYNVIVDTGVVFTGEFGGKVARTSMNIDISKGLFNVLKRYGDIRNSKKIANDSNLISMMPSPTNQILKKLIQPNDNLEFTYYDIDKLKLSYTVNEENKVVYDPHFTALLGHSIEKDEHEIFSIAIVIKSNCPSKQFSTQEKGISILCYSLLNISYTKLNVFRDYIESNQFTHVFLILSPLDIEIFLFKVTPTTFSLIQIITTMLSPFQFQHLTTKFSHLKILNIARKISTPSIVSINVTRQLEENFNSLFGSSHLLKYNYIGELLRKSLNFNTSKYIISETPIDAQKRKKVIRVATVEFEPYVIIIPDEMPDKTNQCQRGQICSVKENEGRKNYCCDGLSIEVLNKITEALNLKYYLYLTDDGNFGSFKNGSWNGMIRELVFDKADIAVQGIEPTVERMAYVNFTPAYMFTHYAIVLRAENEPVPFINWQFMESLQSSLLIAIFFSNIAVIFFIFLLENAKYCFVKRIKQKYFPSREVMTYIFGLTFQRDIGGKIPFHWSGRIAGLSYAIAMTIIMTTYTAHITAKNIKNEGIDGFNGLEDKKILEPSPSFKFAVLKDTSQESFFINNPSTKFAQVWNFMKELSVKTTDEGVEKVFNGELDAFISDDNSILPTTSKGRFCSKLTIYNEMRRQSEVTFAYRNDFVYAEMFSDLILEYREKVVIDIKKKWIYIPTCYQFDMENNRFSWSYFGGILLVIAGTLLASLVILLVENIYVRKSSVKKIRCHNFETL